MIGQTIAGHYHITEELGQGGFGQTYLARDFNLPDKPYCVVKQFVPPRDIPPAALKQAQDCFEREAVVLHELGQEHAQIPRLLAYLEEKGQFFLIQEFIEGKDLSQEIKPGTKLSEEKAIDILEEVLKILTFVHQKRVIHRDIKPSNIVRRKKDGKLFLIDFGTVKQQVQTQLVNTVIVSTQGRSKSRFAFQTLGYTPPEQIKMKPKFASDFYALGMTAIFALTGIHPKEIPEDSITGEIKWRDYAARSLMDRVKINPKLADFLDKMVRQNYCDRYATAEEALKALQEIKLPATRILKKPYIRFNISPKIVAGIALLFALGGASSYYLRQQNRIPLLLTYENSEHGINIDYPDNWNLDKIEDPFTLARFYPRKSDAKDVRVTLEAVEVETDSSLDEYSNINISQILKYLPKARIIDSRKIELNNKPAHRVVYTGKAKNSNSLDRYLQVWFKEADKIFVMTYVAPDEQYRDFGEVVEQTMIPSLVEQEKEN